MPAINDYITYSAAVLEGGTPTSYAWYVTDKGQIWNPNEDLPCPSCNTSSTVKIKWVQSGVGTLTLITSNACSEITIERNVTVTTGCVPITSIDITG